ncbi:hypothetical protein MLD38_040872 [Melastoma candidum]|nr:hypothetical protein MLD38_040872 [Melastoma candidum]
MYLPLLLLFVVLRLSSATQTYIVHVDPSLKPTVFPTHDAWYLSTLSSASETSSPSPSLLYSYSAAFHGFSASLSPSLAANLRDHPSVLSLYPDPILSLHTTRTPLFLGLPDPDLGLSGPSGSVSSSDAEQDVVVGVLDTGVWPESRSFYDAGLGAIPGKWKGGCESGPDFSAKSCNRKLIGARYFSKGYRMASGGISLKKPKEMESPRDVDGHGTHTASTAAGSPVANASLLGYARGTARGMATRARIATYKVCWSTGCFGSDILAGIDRAILDGVDVISMSLGGGSAPYFRDTIAIGAFAAVSKGIFVACSAGNSGPARASLANVAPWIMTVGAGTLDRDFPAFIVLGNRRKFAGVSLYSGPGMGRKPVELVYNKGSNSSSNLCLPGSLDPEFVRGKVVLCDRGVNARVEKGAVVRDAGGVGMILANTAANGEELVADSHLLPAVAVGRKVGDSIRGYVRSNNGTATALIGFGGTVVNVRPSPVVAAFSSRGPNLVTPQILKPDVIGPGVNILAAWSGATGPTGLEKDTRRTKFNILSGTSMSCPHISGLAARLKAAHPDWSPSAIKSALMTTAYVKDNTGAPLRDAAEGTFSTPLVHGAGHVDPQKAMSPGLVYDLTTEDYVAFLCSLDYSIDHIKAIVKQPDLTCSRNFSDPGELNYPSFSVVFGNKGVVRYTREVTNVGSAGSVYQVSVTGPSSVGVTVNPTKLEFPKAGDKRRYTVTFTSKKGSNPAKRSEFGSIIWSDAEHEVHSPVAYAWTQLDS